MNKEKNNKLTKIALVLSILSTGTFTSMFATSDVLADDNQTIILTRPDKQFVPPKQCLDLDGVASEDNSEASAEDDAGTEGTTAAPSGAEPWLVKGSQEYKNAKEVYDTFTKVHGTSSAFALGVLSNIARESRMVMDIKEIEGGQNYAGRGGGLFQITPAETFLNSKYAKQGKSPWEVQNQVNFVWEANMQNRVIDAYLNGSAGNAAGVGMYGLKPIKGVEELISTNDIEFATRYFYAGYLRGRDFAGDMVKSKAYMDGMKKTFETKVIKADKSKWKLGSSSTSGDDSLNLDVSGDDSTLDAKPSDENFDENCAPIDKKEEGTGLFGLEGTGTHNYKDYDAWKPDELPSDLEQYALKPELVDMEYRKSKNWFDLGTAGWSGNQVGSQCTHFANSLFARVWTKDGKTPIEERQTAVGACEWANGGKCNGRDSVRIWSNHLKGTPSKEPHTGAIASVPMDGTEFGHVFMVSHVFENGDLLVIEQNVKKSGLPAHLNYSWEYRIYTKASYKKDKVTFFRPDNLKPNEAYGSTDGGSVAASPDIKAMIKEGKRLVDSSVLYNMDKPDRPKRWPHGAEIGKQFPMNRATDCSAFVRYLWYRHFNVDIGNSTIDQMPSSNMKTLTTSSSSAMSKLKPGDLIYNHYGGHVMMWIGNGQVMHASNYADNLKINPYNPASDPGFVMVRRPIPNKK